MKKIYKVKPYFESLEFSWTNEDRCIFIMLMHEFVNYHLKKQKAGQTITIKFEVTKTIYGEKTKK